jgi:hypothetical protein
MKAHGGVDVQIHVWLTSALVRGEWLASRPGRFTPGEKVPGTHWIGGSVDLTANLDDMETWTFLTLPGHELRTLSRPDHSQLLHGLRQTYKDNRKCFFMFPWFISHVYIVEHPITNKKTPWPESASELTDRATAVLSSKLVPTFVDRGCHVVSVTDPYDRILGFLDKSRFFYQLAPQLYSRGWVDTGTSYNSVWKLRNVSWDKCAYG